LPPPDGSGQASRYKVVKHSQFDGTLDAVTKDPGRANEFVDGATWVLERDPHSGQENHGVWSIPSIDDAYEIYYTIDERAKTVTLVAIYYATRA
jgi:hypothetical protein